MKANATLNHSAAHLLAAAVLKIYPTAKLGIGPAIAEGFYYDFLFDTPLSEADLTKIEKQMQRYVAAGLVFRQHNNAKALASQPFKAELAAELTAAGEQLSFYEMVDPASKSVIFDDLCIGPHVHSTSEIKHFKLINIAGAYWRGSSSNPQLTRIYGTAWETAAELEAYLTLLHERKERDHRKIGKDLQLFTFELLSGQGFPIWLPNGNIVKNEIKQYLRKKEREYGFVEVSTPAFGNKELYRISGHLDHYSDTMFPVIKADNEELIMRPMTCPHHILLYNMVPRSYKDLPWRISEHAQLYRYEKSGALTGLERVRSMELTDAHVFCTMSQITSEFTNAYKLIQEVLAKFHIKIDYVSLSLRDPSDKVKYYNDDKMWTKAEDSLRKVLKDLKISYEEKIGEAAFYGPKIDIQVKTVLGHEITMSTLQLDFLLPKRFNITYIDKNEKRVTPVLIHRGLIGTYERFMSILLEQTKGDLPFWMAPNQVIVLPISDAHHAYAKRVYKKLFALDYRVKLDLRAERTARKIRDAQLSKYNFQLVIGDEEVANRTVSVREHGKTESVVMSVSALVKKLSALR